MAILSTTPSRMTNQILSMPALKREPFLHLKPASDLQNDALGAAAVSLKEHAGFEQYFASVASVPLRTAPSGLSRCFGVPPLLVF